MLIVCRNATRIVFLLPHFCTVFKNAVATERYFELVHACVRMSAYVSDALKSRGICEKNCSCVLLIRANFVPLHAASAAAAAALRCNSTSFLCRCRSADVISSAVRSSHSLSLSLGGHFPLGLFVIRVFAAALSFFVRRSNRAAPPAHTMFRPLEGISYAAATSTSAVIE